MSRKFALQPVLVALALSMLGCGMDALPEDKADYAGFWTGSTINLQIAPDASVDYARSTIDSSTSVNGKIVRFEGDDFVVYAVLNLSFDVSDPPHDEEGVMHMTVNGEDLSR